MPPRSSHGKKRANSALGNPKHIFKIIGKQNRDQPRGVMVDNEQERDDQEREQRDNRFKRKVKIMEHRSSRSRSRSEKSLKAATVEIETLQQVIDEERGLMNEVTAA